MIHVIEGDGKGKTSAAVGMAIRASGYGLSVVFAQFLKDGTSSEIAILKKMNNVKVMPCPHIQGFTFQMTQEQKKLLSAEYRRIIDTIIQENADLFILDEVISANREKIVQKEQIDKLLQIKGEIILTGRDAPQWLLNKADYVSCIKKIKHPYDLGIKARPGIEY